MILAPPLRKALLTAHVATSVGWLGAAAAFLALSVTALATDEVALVRGAYLAMDPITRFALVPLAAAALLTGVVQSLGTAWGLFQHYWVVVKLVLTVVAGAVLLSYTQTVAHLAGAATDPTVTAADLNALAASPVLHAGGGVLVLLVTTILSVYKPRGLTRRGQRKQRQLQQAARQL